MHSLKYKQAVGQGRETELVERDRFAQLRPAAGRGSDNLDFDSDLLAWIVQDQHDSIRIPRTRFRR